MTRLTREEFLRTGAQQIEEHLDSFYTRDFRSKSELYQVMPEAERKAFFDQHDKMTISVPKTRDRAKIYLDGELRDTLPYPLEPGFAQHVLKAFAERFGKTAI